MLLLVDDPFRLSNSCERSNIIYAVNGPASLNSNKARASV